LKLLWQLKAVISSSSLSHITVKQISEVSKSNSATITDDRESASLSFTLLSHVPLPERILLYPANNTYNLENQKQFFGSSKSL
jgi:hypothetical protein